MADQSVSQNNILVGVTGRKYHGKDSVAKILKERGYEQLRFAWPLKAMLRAFYREAGLSEDEIERRIEGDLKEVPCPLLGGKTPRFAMQTLGTEWGRQMISETIWVNALVARARKTPKAIVTDVRFENECQAIIDNGGFVFRVDANKRIPPNNLSDHPSETAIDTLPVNGTFDNNGAPGEMRPAVERAINIIENDECDANDAAGQVSPEVAAHIDHLIRMHFEDLRLAMPSFHAASRPNKYK